jgi:flagellar motor switch protein FliG
MPVAELPTKAAPPAASAPRFSRVQKLAALLVILGPEAAAQVLQGFGPREVEELSAEMAKVPTISPQLRDDVLRDFSQVAVEAGTSLRGGVEVARATLAKAIGVFKATEVLSRTAPSRPNVGCVQAFDGMEPRQIYNLTRQEQPPIIALVLSYISPAKAAEALAFFAPEQRDKILERVATLAPTPVEVIEKVVEVLLARRGAIQTRALNQTGGIKTAAEVLNLMDKMQGRSLLGTLEERNPELGQAIRQKMFTFEDLIQLDAAMLQRLLRAVDVRELALALKRNASEKLKAALLGAVSRRAAEAIQEEIQFMGSVRLKDIQDAQMRILDGARQLDADGVIDLSEALRKGTHEVV